MQTPVGLVCALLLSVSAAQAVEFGADHMRDTLPHIGTVPPISGGWIASLPTISDDCEMKVSKAQLQNVTSRFRDQRGTWLNADFLTNNRSENGFLQDWIVMVSMHKDEACALADNLWGEDGEMFPGVLRKL